MENLNTAYKTSIISYSCFGKGPGKAICFHGYGEDKTSFSFLEALAGSQFTFFAIDLPFHGNTQWKGGDFQAEDLREILASILGQHAAREKLTLIGFSLGGRVALSLYQLVPEKIEKLVLIAPDGLKLNFWYWLSTQTRAGNRLFRLTMKRPHWFFAFLKMLNRLGFVNTSIFKFVSYYVHDKEVREELYHRWTTLRRLRPHLGKIKSLVRQFGTPVRLIYGKHDRIILPSRGEKFRKGIEPQCELKILPSGHQVLHEKHGKEILESLLN